MRKKGASKIRPKEDRRWYNHYMKYLSQLTYQLFEWEGLPKSIDPRYLEMSLHTFGYVGFYKDKDMDYMVIQGANDGQIDRYYRPTHFSGISSSWTHNFKIYNYGMKIDKMSEEQKDKLGVVVYNNDYDSPTIPSLELFAEDLAEIKNVINVNINAQKTPVLITANDNTRLSLVKIYEQYEGNEPVIVGYEDGGIADSISALKTDAPYVVDKLNTQRNAVWNEVMTYLGIKNANLEKKERMITSETDSNNEQIEASTNIWLKSRQEACDRIKELYGLELKVRMRTEIVNQFQQQVKEENPNGLLYNTINGHS
jgi:hypothetical protein